MTIQAIETSYASHRFRSRLEARWAVFFDTLGIRWQYEPEGYHVGPEGDRTPYLPDFRLPAEPVWVEVKGSERQLDVELLVKATVPYYGLPPATGSDYQPGTGHDVPRILVLGPLGQPGRSDLGYVMPTHTVLSFHKGDIIQGSAYFTDRGIEYALDGGTIGNDGPRVYWETRGTDWGNLTGSGCSIADELDERVAAAYRAARSARFEYGENGARR